jgi:hypothetical protein
MLALTTFVVKRFPCFFLQICTLDVVPRNCAVAARPLPLPEASLPTGATKPEWYIRFIRRPLDLVYPGWRRKLRHHACRSLPLKFDGNTSYLFVAESVRSQDTGWPSAAAARSAFDLSNAPR